MFGLTVGHALLLAGLGAMVLGVATYFLRRGMRLLERRVEDRDRLRELTARNDLLESDLSVLSGQVRELEESKRFTERLRGEPPR